MVVVVVEHFLNEEGQRYFPTWIAQIAEELRAFEGFQSIRQLTDIEDEERCVLLLRFENEEQLRDWAASAAHDRMIDKLAPYQIQKQMSQVFRAGPAQT